MDKNILDLELKPGDAMDRNRRKAKIKGYIGATAIEGLRERTEYVPQL